MTGTVHVRWGRPVVEGAWAAWLDGPERRRLAAIRLAEDRRRFVTSRFLLKTLVGELVGTPGEAVRLDHECPTCLRQHGGPAVVGPHGAEGLRVSLAHAGDRVVVAASEAGPVGVDVEPTGSAAFAGFDEVALSAREQRHVSWLDSAGIGDAARAVYWVRKESVLKATGAGLRVDPTLVEVAPPDLPAALTAWRGPSTYRPRTGIRMADVRVGAGHVAAVAVLTDQAVDLVDECSIADLVAAQAGPARTASAGAGW